MFLSLLYLCSPRPKGLGKGVGDKVIKWDELFWPGLVAISPSTQPPGPASPSSPTLLISMF